MKARYEVLKQIRLCLRAPIESFTKELGFSSVSYVEKVEDGKINNVEYIYERYAKIIGIKVSSLRAFIGEAERNNYTPETINAEIRKIMKLN